MARRNCHTDARGRLGVSGPALAPRLADALRDVMLQGALPLRLVERDISKTPRQAR